MHGMYVKKKCENYYTICAKLGGRYMNRILLTIKGFCKNNEREVYTIYGRKLHYI